MVDNFPNYCYDNYLKIYNKVVTVIKKYRRKFKKLKINHIKFDYKLSVFNSKKYLYIVKKVLLEFVKIFPEIRNNELSIFLHGSLARETATLFSDVDFTFCYDNNLRNILIPIEEIISLALVEIFNLKKRAKVHPITNNFENLYQEKIPSNITFDFGGKKVVYNNATYKFKSIYDSINSSRDMDFIVNIYKNKIFNTKFEEFCYSYKQIFCNCSRLNYAKNINNLERYLIKKTSNQDYLHMIQHEINTIKELLNNLCLNKTLKVCYLKSIIKDNPNTKFYNLLCILRRLLNVDFNYESGISINMLKNKKVIHLLTKKNCKNLYKLFHLKNWYLTKVQHVFEIEKLTLSGQNLSEISINKINRLYKKHHKEPFSEVLENIKTFYFNLLNTYSILEKNFHE